MQRRPNKSLRAHVVLGHTIYLAEECPRCHRLKTLTQEAKNKKCEQSPPHLCQTSASREERLFPRALLPKVASGRACSQVKQSISLPTSVHGASPSRAPLPSIAFKRNPPLTIYTSVPGTSTLQVVSRAASAAAAHLGAARTKQVAARTRHPLPHTSPGQAPLAKSVPSQELLFQARTHGRGRGKY